MEQGGTVLDQFTIRYSDIEFGPSIGEGAFGTVYKGSLRGGTAVAIKTMRVTKVTKKIVANFRAEIIASRAAYLSIS